MARFADVLTIVNGKNQKKVENPNGKYPIYGSGGIMGYADDYICEANTVVIGRKGSINNPIFAETPFWNVDTAFGLCAIPTKLHPKYLYYFCEKFDFEQLNTTVTIPSLTKANLLNVEIPLPPLDEQCKIAAVLDKVSDLIAKRRQQLDKLDELVKARFSELLSVIDCIHSAEPLENYLENITYGFTNPMPDSKEGPWKITAKDIADGKINFLTARKTTTEAFDGLTKKSKPLIDDVLLTKDGTLGRMAIVEDANICVNQSVAVLRCNKRVMPKILMYLLQMPEYQQKMVSNAGGGTIKHIYITKVGKMLINIPNIETQRAFLYFVEQTEKTKTTISRS